MAKRETHATTPHPQAAKTPARRIRITDTTLRDAHQSLWATRMRTDDILPILDTVDSAGFYSLECWGGATFDVCLRFLRENPWERLRLIKSRCKTPLQMLLRGQNILGYRNYADDVLRRFVDLAASNGIDIFRIFDALNDNRNLEHAIKAVKAAGVHAQGTISYTVSPVHTVDAYVQLAREQEQMGADSVCIKDMAGILSPAAAERLIGALVAKLSIPVQVHSHMTSGMAIAMYLEAAKAGAGAIDCAVAAMAGFSSQPPVETMLAIFADSGYETGVDVEAVARMNEYFRKLKPHREPSHGTIDFVDVDVLEHHIPGGMISNLRSQLQQQGALDRLGEVLEELPRVRADMGFPPLVTPTSQIVGVQAVLNVLSGERYSMVTQETRDYVKGLYGRSPAPIDAKLAKKILAGEKPVTCRPADLLQPGLAAAARDLDPKLVQGEEDIVSYCLFPEVALGYFKWRAAPADQRPPIPADQERAAEKAGEPATVTAAAAVDQQTLRFASIGRTMAHLFKQMGASLPEGESGLPLIEPLATAPAAAAAAPAETKPAAPEVPAGETINAPLNGTFYRTPGPGKPNFAEEGATVKTGDAVCVVEAMKLFNQIKAHKPCKILKFVAEHGAHVNKGQPLAVIAPA